MISSGMPELTNRQAQVLAFIRGRIEIGEPPPTISELCAHFGFSSRRGAKCHLVALAKKGYLWGERGARALRLCCLETSIPILPIKAMR